jgi:mRNA interferase HigB
LTTSHIVKYDWSVHIVTRKHLREAMQEYPDAANEIKAWVAIVKGVRWHNFAVVRLMFRDADYINGYLVFNIRRNRYRLIAVIHYAKTTDEKRTEGHVYIRSFLTHKEYNDPRKWGRRFGANEYSSRRPGKNDCEGCSPCHTQ